MLWIVRCTRYFSMPICRKTTNSSQLSRYKFHTSWLLDFIPHDFWRCTCTSSIVLHLCYCAYRNNMDGVRHMAKKKKSRNSISRHNTIRTIPDYDRDDNNENRCTVSLNRLECLDTRRYTQQLLLYIFCSVFIFRFFLLFPSNSFFIRFRANWLVWAEHQWPQWYHSTFNGTHSLKKWTRLHKFLNFIYFFFFF